MKETKIDHRNHICRVLALSIFVFSGCTALIPVPKNTPSIILKSEQTRHYFGSTFTVTFPVGRYEPTFQNTAGIYYTAPSPIVIHALSQASQRGGLFVPLANSGNQKQGFWFQDAGHPEQKIRINDPVIFDYAP